MKYFKTFNHVNEKTQLVEKGSLLDIAWNVLTLGQGNKILSSLKNAFSLSGYLIRAKHIKLRRILEETMQQFDSEYKTSKEKVLQSINLISTEIDKFLGNEEIEFKDKIKKLLLDYELENRISGFDTVTSNVLDKIKTDIIKIKSNPEKAALLFADLKQLIPQINKQIIEQRAKKRTAMLPAYLIKNLALDVSKIINRNTKHEEKDKLKIIWEKGKNKIFQDFNKLFDVNAIDNWLNLNNYKVQKYDDKLDALYKKLPNTIRSLASNFKENSFKIVNQETDISFEPYVEYAFKFKTYYLIMWCESVLKDNTTVLIPVGTFKFKNDEFNIFNSYDIKYNNINAGSNIFYYVPNLKSYIIENNPTKTKNIFLWSHKHFGDNARMDGSVAIKENNIDIINKKIANFLWYMDNMKVAELTPEKADQIPTIKEKISAFQALDIDTERRWNTISTSTLNKLGWNATMSNREATTTILQQHII